jgi:curved DNA-binding protein CbpA
MKSPIEYFRILGLESPCTRRELDDAYKTLVKVWHPDRFIADEELQKKAEEQLKQINEAYQALKKSHRRKTKGFEYREAEQPPPRSEGPHSPTEGPSDSTTQAADDSKRGQKSASQERKDPGTRPTSTGPGKSQRPKERKVDSDWAGVLWFVAIMSGLFVIMAILNTPGKTTTSRSKNRSVRQHTPSQIGRAAVATARARKNWKTRRPFTPKPTRVATSAPAGTSRRNVVAPKRPTRAYRRPSLPTRIAMKRPVWPTSPPAPPPLPGIQWRTSTVFTFSTTDNSLYWSREFVSTGELKRREAVRLCRNSSAGGFSDWRLPSRVELEELKAKLGSRIDLPGSVLDYWTQEKDPPKKAARALCVSDAN